MRNPNLKSWQYSKELEGLLIFAQCMQEMLFDYTLDTYKFPAMNTHTLCFEARHLFNHHFENEKLLNASLEPVIEELVWNMKEDKIVEAVLGERKERLISNLQSARGNAKLLNTWVNIVARNLGGGSVFSEGETTVGKCS